MTVRRRAIPDGFAEESSAAGFIKAILWFDNNYYVK
jgi:hypothetical protein